MGGGGAPECRGVSRDDDGDGVGEAEGEVALGLRQRNLAPQHHLEVHPAPVSGTKRGEVLRSLQLVTDNDQENTLGRPRPGLAQEVVEW